MPPLCHTRMLTDFTLCRSYAVSHRSCVFMKAMLLLCPVPQDFCFLQYFYSLLHNNMWPPLIFFCSHLAELQQYCTCMVWTARPFCYSCLLLNVNDQPSSAWLDLKWTRRHTGKNIWRAVPSWTKMEREKSKPSHYIHISLLHDYWCDMSSCLIFLLPCLPQHDELYPLLNLEGK